MTAGVPNARSCYCKPGETTCGTCERCGAAGHTRHFPGAVPATGAWCDRCYSVVAWQHRMKLIALPAIIITVVLLMRVCAR